MSGWALQSSNSLPSVSRARRMGDGRGSAGGRSEVLSGAMGAFGLRAAVRQFRARLMARPAAIRPRLAEIGQTALAKTAALGGFASFSLSTLRGGERRGEA